jgi:sn-glycerol 3-phosphate transport system ATP-binding protein
MSQVEACSLTKQFGKTTAARDVSFVAQTGSFVVLLGPSGCGKSTILRMIAGLESPTSGQVLIDGQDVTTLDPSRRRISMVFQSYALFPHLNVADNILFGLKVRHAPRADQQRRLKRVADMVGLSHLLDRKPAQLSGGQRQRVALARAIVAEHPICLMDEPLSNLDAKLRHEMRLELRALQQRLEMTVLYVTHDQTEAMSMADQVILLNNGQVVQAGTPETLYQRPATTFAADFIGTPPMNLIVINETIRRSVSGNSYLAALINEKKLDGCTLGIRPEHMHISDSGDGLQVNVSSEDYHGSDTIVGVRPAAAVDQEPAEIKVRVQGRVRLPQGRQLGLFWEREHMQVFGSDGRSIAV